MKNTIAGFLSLLIVCTGACTMISYHDSGLNRDFTTEGFLDSSHFQVIVKGMPDPAGRGLVEKRESARKNADLALRDTVMRRLITWYIHSRVESKEIAGIDEIINLPEAEAELREKLAPWLKYGRVAYEYYNEDHSAVLVYRIYRDNLQGSIESINVKLLRAAESTDRTK